MKKIVLTYKNGEEREITGTCCYRHPETKERPVKAVLYGFKKNSFEYHRIRMGLDPKFSSEIEVRDETV